MHILLSFPVYKKEQQTHVYAPVVFFPRSDKVKSSWWVSQTLLRLLPAGLPVTSAARS